MAGTRSQAPSPFDEYAYHTYHAAVFVEWNPDKARRNFREHDVSFSEAELVLFDPLALTMEDNTAEGEHRYVSLGKGALARILVVVYSYRDDCTIRLISARKASAGEVKTYEK